MTLSGPDSGQIPTWADTCSRPVYVLSVSPPPSPPDLRTSDRTRTPHRPVLSSAVVPARLIRREGLPRGTHLNHPNGSPTGPVLTVWVRRRPCRGVPPGTRDLGDPRTGPERRWEGRPGVWCRRRVLCHTSTLVPHINESRGSSTPDILFPGNTRVDGVGARRGAGSLGQVCRGVCTVGGGWDDGSGEPDTGVGRGGGSGDGRRGVGQEVQRSEGWDCGEVGGPGSKRLVS